VDNTLVLKLMGLLVLVACSALLTGAEAAYFSLGRTRLKRLAEEEGDAAERATKPLLEQPHELLVTLLVGITLINIGAAALAAAVAERVLGPAGLPIAIVVMVFLLSVFGEVLPMTVAVEHPEGFIAWVKGPVAWLSTVVMPIRVAVGAVTALSLRLVGSERKDDAPEISEAELRTLVDVGAREGVVERTEREMIHRVFELEDTLVREVMVPELGGVRK
jgi:putative hemolysin